MFGIKKAKSPQELFELSQNKLDELGMSQTQYNYLTSTEKIKGLVLQTFLAGIEKDHDAMSSSAQLIAALPDNQKWAAMHLIAEVTCQFEKFTQE
jgi:hypothetical protein